MAKKVYKNKKWLGLLLLVALVVVAGAFYVKTSQHSAVDTATQTNSNASKQYSQTAGSQSAGESGSSQGGAPGSTSNQAASSSNNSLQAPSGQLLNKQSISLTSTDPQNDPNLESVCQTLANAECNIVLTGPSGQSLSVGNHATGSSGTVIIDWNAKTVGLTPGKWIVQAVATQNGQTGTSHNEYLQVSP